MFFKSTDNYTHSWDYLQGGGSDKTLFSVVSRLFNQEEKPSNMAILSSLLVMSLHLSLVIWLLQPAEAEITPPKPLVMEVAMVSTEASEQKQQPPPPPSPPKPEKKVEPKTKPKPVVKNIPKIVQKAEDFAPQEKVVEQAVTTSAPTNTTVTESKPSPVVSEQFTEARFNANYLQNPAPKYPTVAKYQGWTGKVLLRVSVSEQGLPESVEIYHSSGHQILDESALEAVKKWRFVPAKRGETVVASAVIVPIIFNLEQQER